MPKLGKLHIYVKSQLDSLSFIIQDNVGLHLLRSSGKKRQTFFENSAHKYRGLTYDPINGWLITLKMNEEKGVHLVFIVLPQNKEDQMVIVKEVHLKQTRYIQ